MRWTNPLPPRRWGARGRPRSGRDTLEIGKRIGARRTDGAATGARGLARGDSARRTKGIRGGSERLAIRMTTKHRRRHPRAQARPQAARCLSDTGSGEPGSGVGANHYLRTG